MIKCNTDWSTTTFRTPTLSTLGVERTLFRECENKVRNLIASALLATAFATTAACVAAPATAATGNSEPRPVDMHHIGVTIDELSIDGYTVRGTNGDPSMASLNVTNGPDYAGIGVMAGPDYVAFAHNRADDTAFEIVQVVIDHTGVNVYGERFEYGQLGETETAAE